MSNTNENGSENSNVTDPDGLIMAWLESVKTLAAAKEAEAELRKRVLAECFEFGENDDREGTQNFELGNGYKLKAVFKINRTLDNKDGAVDDMLSALEKMGNEGSFIADRIVTWKASLVKKEYDDLSPAMKKVVDGVVTSKPGTPSLEFVEPKSK